MDTLTARCVRTRWSHAPSVRRQSQSDWSCTTVDWGISTPMLFFLSWTITSSFNSIRTYSPYVYSFAHWQIVDKYVCFCIYISTSVRLQRVMLVLWATNVLQDVHLYITSACPVILIYVTHVTHTFTGYTEGGGGEGRFRQQLTVVLEWRLDLIEGIPLVLDDVSQPLPVAAGELLQCPRYRGCVLENNMHHCVLHMLPRTTTPRHHTEAPHWGTTINHTGTGRQAIWIVTYKIHESTCNVENIFHFPRVMVFQWGPTCVLLPMGNPSLAMQMQRISNV